MKELFVCEVGPVENGKKGDSLLLPLTDSGPLQPLIKNDTREDLRAIAELYGNEYALTCAPELEVNSRELGYRAVVLPKIRNGGLDTPI